MTTAGAGLHSSTQRGKQAREGDGFPSHFNLLEKKYTLQLLDIRN